MYMCCDNKNNAANVFLMKIINILSFVYVKNAVKSACYAYYCAMELPVQLQPIFKLQWYYFS